MASLTATLMGAIDRLARLRLSIGALHGARTKTEPRAKERVVGYASHADEHHAVTGFFTDGSVWADELGLAIREEQELGPRRDVGVKPPARRIGTHNGDDVGVVEKLHQPRHVSVSTPEWRIHKHQPVPRLLETIVLDGVDLPRGHPMTGAG